MSIEPLFNGELLPGVLIGGASIYQFTPCTPEVASARQPKQLWQLPTSIVATLPQPALPAPEQDELFDDDCGLPDWITGADGEADDAE